MLADADLTGEHERIGPDFKGEMVPISAALSFLTGQHEVLSGCSVRALAVLRYYWRLLRALPTLLLPRQHLVNGVLFLVATLLAITPALTARWSTTNRVKAYAASFPLWWPLVPIGLLALLGLLKLNYDLYSKVERQRNRLRARLDDRVKRQEDAGELRPPPQVPDEAAIPP